MATEFDRDIFGRVIEETSLETDGLIRTIRTGFDEAGNVVALRSGSGSTVTFTYDAAGRMMSRSGPAPRALTRMGYDLDGRPRSQSIHSSAGSWTTTMTYDAAGRPLRTNFPDGTFEEVVQYAPDDLATIMRNRYGQTVAMTYDFANRLTLVSPSGGPANVAKYDMAYTYDAASRPTAWRKIGRPLGTISVPAPGFDLGGRPRALRMGEAGQSLDVAVALEHSGFDDLNEIRITQGDLAGDPTLGAATFLQGFDVLKRRERSRYFRGTNVALTGSTQNWAGAGSLVKQTTESSQRDYVSERTFGGPGRPKRLEFKGGGQPWGALTFAYRAGDGYQESRASGNGGVFSSMGIRLTPDGGLRLTDAEVGGPAAPLEKFAYAMGPGDEMLGEAEQKQGNTNGLGVGPSGRVQSRNGVSYAYDDLGNRTEDDRFLYSWTWRGELETVTVKPTWPSEIGGPPAAAPNAGHKIFFEYDALGRLVERLHRGPLPTGSTDDAVRSIVERRTYLWQDANLLIERSQNESGEVLYRKIYAPGAGSEAGEMRVENFGANPAVEKFGFLRDEEGNVVGLIDENSTSTKPPVPIRVHYSPYGESHLETGPELKASKFDPARTELNGTVQDPPHPSPNETLPGAVVFDFTIDLDPGTFGAGILFERMTPNGWDPVPASDYALAAQADDPTRVVLLMKGGWPKATDFRIRVGTALRDQLGRTFVSPDAPPATYTVEINVPPNGTTPPIHERTWPFRYDTLAAASYTLEGRVPGGLGFLFRSGLTDNVTGLVYLAGSWYDPRTLSGLGEQGTGYAFEGRMPDQAVYGAMGYRAPQQVPMGMTTHGFDGGAAGSFWHGAAKAVGKAVLVVGVIAAAAVLASTGVGAPAAAGLYLATIGTGFLVTSTVQAAADRYIEGQSGGQILVGAVADGTGFGSIYAGMTGQDLTTGQDLGLTDEERGDMFGSGATDFAMNFLCVAEGTQVLTSEGHRNVEDVCIGDRLLTPQTLARPPDDRGGEEEAADRDPSAWRVVRLCVPSPNGESPAEIQLLRPVEWIAQAGLGIGVTLPVTTETESLGNATVLSIEPAPSVSGGAGRLVTMKASRVAGSAQIVTVRDVDGQLSDLVITGSHPVHVDGRGWVPVQHLKEGDQLVGDAGQLLPVERIESRAGPVRVETFEVEIDHTFLVAASDLGPAVWVHNGVPKVFRSREGRVAKYAANSTNAMKAGGRARGRFFNKVGRMTQQLGSDVLTHVLGKGSFIENAQLGGRELDWDLAKGFIEAKYRLPISSAPLKRLVAQLRVAGATGQDLAVWTLKKPGAADLRRLQRALGDDPLFARVTFLRGVDELATYASRFK